MTRLSLAVRVAAILAFAALAGAEDYDLLVRDARVVDGTGAPWRRADVAVRGDTIVAVAARIKGSAKRVVLAGNRVVAPGFIDLHTHARQGIFQSPGAENYVRQGVTTLVEGPDGSSALPLGPFLDRVEALGPGVNFASLVGHGSIREAVLGRADRAPAAAELARMQELVRR
jgi:dihydroorotase/N-acyl-D-amino-acid deacylase